MFKLGVENLIENKSWHKKLNDQKLALLAHPASTNQNLVHSLDLIASCKELNLTTIFGPQHGFKGDKQDNMIESNNQTHPKYNIPIFSLYSKIRRPTKEMMEGFDTLLVDLQDVGCRIYTYLTTLFYMIEACEKYKRNIFILDRPNPAGRPVEGFLLNMDLESFVGAAPLVMRHGLTLGEAARWYVQHKNINLNIEIIEMLNYKIDSEPWPVCLPWVNPSPNLPRISSTHIYAGTVLLEGTCLSEGRGTTRPFEMIGAPDIDAKKIYKTMKELRPNWLKHCLIQTCTFEPQFQKHQQKLCFGLHFHTDTPKYNHEKFKPFRLICLFLKSLKIVHPSYNLWRDPPYEYESIEKPFDILSGDKNLRTWIDNPKADCNQLEEILNSHEEQWLKESRPYYLY